MRTFTRKYWPLTITAAIAMAVLLVAAACSGDSKVQGASVLSAASVQTEEQSQTLEQGQTVEQAVPQIVTDADAIVAAQEEVLNRIYETALPSVVHIRVTQTLDRQSRQQPFDFDSPFSFRDGPRVPELPEDFFRRGEGSGFIWDDQGHIVTNHHVIDGASRVTVILADSTELEAEVVGSDPDSDLAVVKAEFPMGAHAR